MSLFNLKDKSILITGSSRGIGKAIAKHCAMHGANVIISSRKEDACIETANEINSLVGEDLAYPIAASISNTDQLELLVSKTREKYGKIDVLICNAATNPFMGSMLDMPSEKFDKVMENNIKSNQFLCNLVIPEMVDRNDGSIIIISSIGGLKGSSILGAYNISKAADIMMVKNIAAEFGKNNIRANSIAPGLIKTDFAKALWENPDILKSVLVNTPMQRIGEPDEIAGVAVMLSSKAGEYINGQTIVVDGGTTIV
ncbi:glucose 1-dehydrogenase [Gammaproteobacteria bacterium]|jgi:NAD(P)-dependent dehydrogenase (short-subunit alcohol dehydrogenase family)|nr:glucose 1-dehydrogenase [Gammaproteobacteria bacterium]|tara:strand:+ start:248 stop:1015 length:768 start_codon:yes stop_codon:yes gene_type:complete